MHSLGKTLLVFSLLHSVLQGQICLLLQVFLDLVNKFNKLNCLFNLCAEYIMRSVGLDEAQAGIKIAGRNINNLRYADDTTLMAESEEEQRAS